VGCEPSGNICGAFGANARQDCCDGKKDVCGLDAEGIARCFGGCPSGHCGAACPAGYASNADGGCCIAAGDACQFRDQCCDGSPCVPNDLGVLTCTPQRCIAAGSACTPGAPGSGACCQGLDCARSGGELGQDVCMTHTSTTKVGPDGGLLGPDGGALLFPDGGRATLPDGGLTVDAGPVCRANGATCAGAGDCCSSYCVGGACAATPACQAQSGVCTASADCCLGLSCNIPGGAVSGTCQPGATCASAGQPCATSSTCCLGLSCLDQGVACTGAGCTCSVVFR
jgi:hypothetical protein